MRFNDTTIDYEDELNNDSSEEETVGGRKIKRRPGESKVQAIARIEKAKEVDRIQKLMKFAFPRQRDSHVYRKQLLSPEDYNMSVGLLSLKKESVRM